MSIEKPISTLRKAIIGSAEKIASEESNESPKKKHYDAALQFFRAIKKSNPEYYEKVIHIAAESKDIKDELNEDVYEDFTRIWNNLGDVEIEFLNSEIKKIVRADSKSLDSEKIIKEILGKYRDYLFKKACEIQKAPWIIKEFKNKRELLDKMITFIIESNISMLEMTLSNNFKQFDR